MMLNKMLVHPTFRITIFSFLVSITLSADRSSSDSALLQRRHIDNSSNDIIISSCTLDTVEIHPDLSATNIPSGHIIVAGVRKGIDKNNNPICCSTCTGHDDDITVENTMLFRKIISRVGDASNTYKTEFASFEEVFPREILDANNIPPSTEVEPLLHFNEQNQRPTTATESTTTTWKRKLQEGRDFYYNLTYQLQSLGLFGGSLGVFGTALFAFLVFITCPCWFNVLLWIGGPSLFAGLSVWGCLAAGGALSASWQLGHLWDFAYYWYRGLGRDDEENAGEEEEEVAEISNVDRALLGGEESLSSLSFSSPLEENLFLPTNINDWMTVNSEGNCSFVKNCNIGTNGDPRDCFVCKDICSDGCDSKVRNIFLPDDIISSVTSSSSNFHEACENHDYCYMSSIGKDACDGHFFRSMIESCHATTIAKTTTTFPLPVITLGHNCQLLAVLFYIGMKFLGHGPYQKAQMEQTEYKQAICV